MLETRRDSIIAWSITIAVHAAFVVLLWGGKSASGGNAGHAVGAAGSGDMELLVDYVQVARKPVAESQKRPAVEPVVTPPQEAESVAPSPPTVLDVVALRPEGPSSTQPPTSANVVPSLSLNAGSSPGAGGSLQDNGYLAAIKQAVLNQWQRQRGDQAIGRCLLVIRQQVGGAVSGAKIEGCDLDAEARLALEAAALMAQPLPYAGYESAFTEELRLAF